MASVMVIIILDNYLWVPLIGRDMVSAATFHFYSDVAIALFTLFNPDFNKWAPSYSTYLMVYSKTG